MHVDAYLAHYAAFWSRGQLSSDPVFPNDPESERPFLRFVWRAVCAHAWIQSGMLHDFRPKDARNEGVRSMREHAEASAHLLARLISESDPFEKTPMGGTPRLLDSPDVPDGWVHVGLSALMLRLLTDHAGARLAPVHSSSRRDLAWIAEGFALECRYALSEAGRCASRHPEGAERLKNAIAAFRPAGEFVWGDAFLLEAREALSGRDVAIRPILRSAIEAVREVPEFPRDAWSYLEPHLARHGERLKIGRLKRFALKTLVNHLVGK